MSLWRSRTSPRGSGCGAGRSPPRQEARHGRRGAERLAQRAADRRAKGRARIRSTGPPSSRRATGDSCRMVEGPIRAWLSAARVLNGSDLLLVTGRPPMCAPGAAHAVDGADLTTDDIAARRGRSSGTAPGSVRGRRSHRSRVFGRRARALSHESPLRARPRGGGHPRPADGGAGARRSSDSATTSRPWRGCRAACYWSAARPDRARPRRWLRSSARSTPTTIATSSPSRIRSNTNTRTGAAWWSRWRSAWTRPVFPSALRSALRQAPDVIVIGEMRDTESIRIACGARQKPGT